MTSDNLLKKEITLTSKKIKKRPTGHGIAKKLGNKSLFDAKYQTFDTQNKTIILHEIKKQILKLLDVSPCPENMTDENLLSLISKIDLEDYNKILKKVLSAHVTIYFIFWDLNNYFSFQQRL